MNIANVMERFSLLCGIDISEASKWRSVIEDSEAYINSRLLVDEPTAEQQKRIDMLVAAYAYKTYCLCNENNVTAFKAGEVQLTSSARRGDGAQKLWRKLISQSGDLISGDEFLFGRVI
ncbi:MAG: hypothetical protein UFA98_05860 [Ruminococcus sp.]|nr:hypothetical protein [Ruminococcus sp.]